METNCIGCHNNDPNSTKRDWKVGEVGGVLEIIRPLDRDIARTRQGLRGTFVLMAAVSGFLLLLSGFVLFVRSRRIKGAPGSGACDKTCNAVALIIKEAVPSRAAGVVTMTGSVQDDASRRGDEV